MDFKRPEDLQ